jgi:DNA-binding Lrp family transcriptional regulator
MDFTETETEILRRVQGTIPDTARPFAAIAEDVNQALGLDPERAVDEEDVLALVRRLKQAGAIRRFGATLRHQKAGFGANAMVAWRVDDPDEADRLGSLLAARSSVSHCYRRRTAPDWPYTLYTMVHGRSPEECLQAVEEMRSEAGVDDYAVLFSTRELKKTSMRYF